MRMVRPRNASRQTRALIGTLLASPRVWRHGYELAKETGLKSGTLYPLLMRLGDQGLLESKWREATGPGRPPRHLYRLSSQGLALARRLSLAPQDTRVIGGRRAATA
jgi:PadR family transcriptional regulator, regulatory protein PadR